MDRIGMNVDPYGRISPASVADSGATAIRFVARAEEGVRARILSASESGIKCLAIITQDSRKRPDQGGRIMGWRETAEYWAWSLVEIAVVPVWAVQLGNEPDGAGESSDYLGQVGFNEMLDGMAPVFRNAANLRQLTRRVPGLSELTYTVPHPLLIVAGAFSNGHAEWLSENGGVHFPDELNAAAYHNYTKAPDDYGFWNTGSARDLHAAYREAIPDDLPLWVTEYGTPFDNAPKYYEKMTTTLLDLDAEWIFPFCWDDAMVPGFGLKEGNNGNPKTRYDGFKSIATGVRAMASIKDAQEAAYKVANPTVVYNPDSAIVKKWLELKASGKYIGVPVGSEITITGDSTGRQAAQPFSSGAVLVWYGATTVKVE